MHCHDYCHTFKSWKVWQQNFEISAMKINKSCIIKQGQTQNEDPLSLLMCRNRM